MLVLAGKLLHIRSSDLGLGRYSTKFRGLGFHLKFPTKLGRKSDVPHPLVVLSMHFESKGETYSFLQDDIKTKEMGQGGELFKMDI